MHLSTRVEDAAPGRKTNAMGRTGVQRKKRSTPLLR